MNKSLYTDKRAVSEMVSYTLLIIIAVGVSVLVYNYLQVLTPKDKPSCPDDVNLALKSYTCTVTPSPVSGEPPTVALSLNIYNKGLHTVDAVYIRIGPESRKIRELVNEDNVFFGYVSGSKTGLPPGSSVSKEYSIKTNRITAKKNLLELQPAVGISSNFALCENAVTVQTIDCE